MIHHYKNNKAFTLAEVLITLGIIGVVAAMTLPVLVANYQKIQAVAQLKRTYNVLSNAIRMSMSENGDVQDWVITSSDINGSSEFANTYLLPYLKVVKNCGASTSGDCSYSLKNPNGTDASSRLANYSRFILNDGTIVFIFSKVNTATHVFPRIIYVNVDINGLKMPNKMGRDYFEFALALDTNDDMYKPLGRLNASGQSQPMDTVKSHCTKADATYCSALIIKEGWSIPKDYPYPW